jgi:HK97 family phage portal protein
MSILTNLYNKIFVKVGETNTELSQINDYLNFPGTDFDLGLAESISTIYTSCKILAEDVGSFPIELYKDTKDSGKLPLKDDYRYSLLHYNPNEYTSSNTFFSTLEYIRNIKGNAFAQISRINKSNITSLTIVDPSKIVTYKVINNRLLYGYQESENTTIQWIDGNELLHFKSLSSDGIWGINPIEKLRLNLSTTYKAFSTIDKFYDNNATSPKALKTTVPEGINPKEWQNKIADFTEKYGGFKNAGKVISLPPFTELQDITLSFADAEFIATIRFNADQIASLYRIPPHLVGNFESSKFNNLEQLQLNYKINTIRPILRMYRQELEQKLLTTEERLQGISIEFNTNALVETDAKTRIENLKSLFGMGVVTPNEIINLEGKPFEKYEGGDNHFLLTQLMSVEKYNQKPTTNISQQ